MILLASSGWLMAQTSETVVTINGEKVVYDEKLSNQERLAKYGTNPPEGTMIFNTDTKCHEFWNGTDWYNYCWGGVTDPATTIIITNEPADPAAICSGTGTQTITVTATGAGINYTWMKDGIGISDDSVINGQGTPTLTLTNPSAAYAGNYTVRVFSGTDSKNSRVVRVVVNAVPEVLTATPGSRTWPGTVVLGATASPGSTLNWYGSATGGTLLGTGTSFTTPHLDQIGNLNIYFYVEATSPCGTSARTPVRAIIAGDGS